jgi:NAD(P)-dependent dehydrogenase (short-subunit alcohol dehydrogenase family)
MAAANGALASLAWGLAIELAPVRVNVISPGWVDTPIWDQLGMDKQAAFAELAERLPAQDGGHALPDPVPEHPATGPRLTLIHHEARTGRCPPGPH